MDKSVMTPLGSDKELPALQCKNCGYDLLRIGRVFRPGHCHIIHDENVNGHNIIKLVEEYKEETTIQCAKCGSDNIEGYTIQDLDDKLVLQSKEVDPKVIFVIDKS